MADKVTDADLAKDCLLKWWEIKRILQHWSELCVESVLEGRQLPPYAQNIGSLARDPEETSDDWARRITRGMMILSREDLG